jgi:hypothetical protein
LPFHWLRRKGKRCQANVLKIDLSLLTRIKCKNDIKYLYPSPLERDIEFAAKPLETSRFQVENIKFAYVFYEDGLVVNVMYTVDDPKKRAVGFKLSEGMEVPKELGKFKFARQKSKLAGTIRGSFFVIKGEY